jgi:scyllo-inositol 2-dehydrogenase (NADP+)
MSKIRIAAVGLGWVALHRHLPTMEQSTEFEIVGVIDRASGVAKKIAKARGYDNFAETSVLAEIPWLSDVDAITVTTAPMGHFSVISQALRLQKHVLTEKPFAMSIAEGEELVKLASDVGCCLAIVHNFQFARSTRRLLSELKAGNIGSILAINAVQFGNPRRRLPVWYEELPLGLFYDESPHLLYLLRLLAGSIQVDRSWIFPSSKGLKTPARIDAIFRSPLLACPVSLHCNFESPVSEWHLMVFGEKRLAVVDIFRDIYISLPNDEQHSTMKVLRTSMSATGQHLWQHIVSGIPHLTGKLMYGNKEVFARFAGGVRGDETALSPVSAESALAVLRLQHEIVEQCQFEPCQVR